MQKPLRQPTKDTSLNHQPKKPILFVIPNPFDDYTREKKGWYTEVKKIEGVLKSVKDKMNELAIRQVQHRERLSAIKEYCTLIKTAGKNKKGLWSN